LQIDREGDESALALFDAISSFQDKVLTDAVGNSKPWFGNSKMSRDVIEALFYPMLKFPKNKETDEVDKTRNPSMKLKVPFWEGTYNVELYDMDKNLLFNPAMSDEQSPIDLVPSGSHITGLIECGGLWFAGGRCGITWKLLQAKVRQPVRIRGFCMLEDSDEEETVENLDKADADEQVAGQVESDDEPAEELMVEPETPKKPKKKRVVKKKSAES
jgi:hypothetical protein